MNEKRNAFLRADTPTLADVARLANVSEITASRVVRNRQPIAEATRLRVLSAIQQLGYIPNRAAGSLASAGSTLISVVLPSLSNIVFAEVLNGIHSALSGTPFQAVIGVTDYDREAEARIVRSFLEWQPAAIIVVGLHHTPAARGYLEKGRFRVGELMDIDGEAIDVAVGMSHRQAGYDSGRHLLQRGYRRLGYVGHDLEADDRARARYEGLCAALRDSGLPPPAERRFDVPTSTTAGRDLLALLLTEHPGLDAVVFSNDDMAVGGFFYCLEKGIRPKEQLALFGFSGLEIGQALPMPLSTVRSQRFLAGKLIVEKLLASRERPAEKVTIDIGYEIVEGATA
ncbi:LacI family DNA-binding transcriptional regulator [Bosea sp. (in: a-proteobacteria)]|uniref:LacI family DNA-binding transcriptional regulator n=1 Tax=Bosea sp. (in: a-proteobacteria) TaxID=1871050 RepID=UPI00263A1F22|nr:LacI family DNA-binding transcriptional regulator [Bosea sp. (in: a-proteobacteria)]MCO5089514.1 LacI family DNA-binding transcriptional regulator [Bosea sp. (in: a-proteobacteria)]